MGSLTVQAQGFVAEHLNEGDWGVDATAGNGNDTLFLARAVGARGMVYAFDVQREALKKTRELLGDEFSSRVKLYQASHAEMRSVLPVEQQGQIAVVMFNLGYLPGGDKELTTKTESTVVALEQSLHVLKPGGVLSVLAYPGHAAGEEETEQVSEFFKNQSGRLQVEQVCGARSVKRSPQLFLAVKG